MVITRNRVDSLLRTLRHLDDTGEAGRVVVVDNGSRDGTAERVRRAHPHVAVVSLDRNAGAAARNLGVESTGGPFVAFCDDDTQWEPGSLRRAAEHLRRCPEVAVVAGTYVLADGRTDPLAEQMARSPLGTRDGQPGPRVLGFQAGSAIVRREAFLAAGGFHPRFGVGGEESLLALDLVDAGWDLCHAPDVRVRHDPAPRSVRDGRRRRRREARNDLRVALLRRPAPDVIRVAAVVLRTPSGWAAALGAVADLHWTRRERRVLRPATLRSLALVEGRRPGRRPGVRDRLATHEWSMTPGRVQREEAPRR